MHKTRLPAWAVLTIIAIVAALLLGATYQLTKGTIEGQEIENAAATRRALLPKAVGFEPVECESPLTALYEGKDVMGLTVGYVATTHTTGFGGDIEIILGLDAQGVLTGVRVGGSDFAETPGLGAKAKEPAFTDQFTGLTLPVVLNEGVDAITSATITSNAVIRGVNTAADAVAKIAGFGQEKGADAGLLENDHYYARVQGFGGPVYVEIALDENGAISEIVVGDDAFKETDGLGSLVKDAAFTDQFIGLTGAAVLGENIDAVSRATISSSAVVDAVNAALDAASGKLATSVQGFGGPVYVEIKLDENGAIAEIIVGDDAFKETDGLGSLIKEPSFTDQFIGLSEKAVLGENIDAVSRATISSTAVVDAVNELLGLE